MTITSSYSQNSFPKKIVLNNDTVIAITSHQLVTINQKLLQLAMYKEVASDCGNSMATLNKSIEKANALIAQQSELIAFQKAQISDLNKLDDYSKQNIEVLKKQLKLQRQRTVKAVVIGSGVTALVTATVISLLK